MPRAPVYLSLTAALVAACSATAGNEPHTHPTQAGQDHTQAPAPSEQAASRWTEGGEANNNEG